MPVSAKINSLLYVKYVCFRKLKFKLILQEALDFSSTLMQKCFVKDYLTKKVVKNRGEKDKYFRGTTSMLAFSRNRNFAA